LAVRKSAFSVEKMTGAKAQKQDCKGVFGYRGPPYLWRVRAGGGEVGGDSPSLGSKREGTFHPGQEKSYLPKSSSNEWKYLDQMLSDI
jgi:hypothetical protein